jgi:hypothetical protein
MKIKIVKSKIDVLDYIKDKAYQIEIDGHLGSVVDVSEIDKELKRLFDRLEELEDENE